MSTNGSENPSMVVDSHQKKRRVCFLACSMIGVFFLLVCLIGAWDHKSKYQATSTSDTRITQDDDDNIDDDSKRDDVCKAYVMKFLNGTTDDQDECEGMLNAYEAADCKNDGGNAFVIDGDDDDHAADDVLIDDAYEAWECCSSIYKYYTRNCHTPDLASFQLMGIVLVLVLCGLAIGLIRALELMWIPDAGVCILVGAAVGGAIKMISPRLSFDNDNCNLSSFNNNLFLHILLPPIIFASALKIDKRSFWSHIGPILMLAIVGTAMSTMLIGLTTFGLTQISEHSTKLPLLDSLLFGSLASSIDPVATLGILDSVGVSRTDTLYVLVFGESLLNDGVAIVLFESLSRNIVNMNSTTSLQGIFKRFLVVSGGSLAIGIACGFCCMIYFCLLESRHPAVMEVSMFFCWALIPYYISDALGLSGIISIMTAGFLMDYFVVGGCQSEETQWIDYLELERPDSSNMTGRVGSHGQSRILTWVSKLKRTLFSGRGCISARSSRHVVFVADVIATIMETAIFSYLGLFLFSNKYMADLRINATAILSCVVSRAVMVLVLSFVLNGIAQFELISRAKECIKRHNPPNDNPSGDNEEDETTVESSVASNNVKTYLTMDTQAILFLAGVRGAVSFALVENLPLYNALTRSGSPYKAELKAMTSSSILFTIFVFGAATYFRINHARQRDAFSLEGVRRGLMQRLLSQPLASSDDDDGDDNSSQDTPPFNIPSH